MDIATVIFYLIAAALVGSALAVVTLRNIVHAAMFLVVVFGAAAGIYVLLNAEFIAIVQILIYAGAVTILILFAIMLTHNPMARNSNPVSNQWWFAALVSLGLLGTIVYALANSANSAAISATTAQTNGSVVRIGQLLYSPFTYSYVLPFEVASIVLLVAIIGAIVIGRED